ncbi:MAG TPA: DUF1467 family protein [Dongiaceae bacterium]|jgi:predicted secreted protein|nr:DUF1467 family protein [Dongiaceae bacterium]
MVAIIAAIAAQIFTYVMIWWVIFFAILPWGIQQPAQPERGHDRGAPLRHDLKRKFWITSGISLFVWGGYFIATHILHYSLLDLPI